MGRIVDLVPLAGLAACLLMATPAHAHKVSYEPFGIYDPAAASEVEAGYKMVQNKKSPQPDPTEVKVLLKTFPEGVHYEGGAISVDEGSNHEVLGSFEWIGKGLLPKEEAAPGELAKIAKLADGNMIVLTEIRVDRGFTHSARGFILNDTSR